jgi:hypothetical protein
MLRLMMIVFAIESYAFGADVSDKATYDDVKDKLAKLDGALPTVGQGLNSGMSMPEVGKDLCQMGTDLSTLGKSTNFTRDWANSGFTAHLNALLSDLGPVPKPSKATDYAVINRILVSASRDMRATEINLSDTTKVDFASFQKNLGALGGDVFSLGVRVLGPGSEHSAELSRIFGTTNQPALPYRFFISSGARFQSPFTVSYNKTAGTAVLTNSGNSTVGFLEFSFFDRFVLRPQRSSYKSKYSDTTADSKWHFMYKWDEWLRPDIEWNLGFLFASGANSTNFPVSTIAGGGNFWTDTSVGFPVARFQSQHLMQQLTFELSGGASTDENIMAVHPSFLVGMGYQASFTAPALLGNATNTPAFIISRVGYGMVDIPQLTSSTNLNVKVTNLPQYDLQWSPAIGTSFAYPLGNGSYLVLDINAYIRNNPTPWNISAGITIPLGSLGNIFK